MIRPSSSTVPIRNGSRFSRKKPYIGHRTRKNADPSLRFGPHRASGDSLAASAASSDIPATSARRRSGISDNRLHTLSYRFSSSICFRFLRMKPLPTEETFHWQRPRSCGRKPQPADTEIPDANILGTWKLHNRHPTIGEKTFTPATPRSLLPSIPKADVSSCCVPFRTSPKPVFQSEPRSSQTAYSGGSDVSTAGATSSPLRKSRGRRHGRPTAS